MTFMPPVTVIHGSSPIILGQPHSGTYIPDTIFARLNVKGRQLIDTDWHIPTLYDALLPDCTIVRANFHRYVIDANRAPDGQSLYPGQNTTSLVPMNSFDGESIWSSPPTDADVEQNLREFHRAYHDELEAEITRVKAIHGIAILYDCHSIRSEIPYLFDNQLPHLSIGDNSGRSCSVAITDTVIRTCQKIGSHTFVTNGRFKGGWTTRHYGHPDESVHAIQMEIAQRSYLKSEMPPFEYDAQKAAPLRELLRSILKSISTTLTPKLSTEK